SIACATDASSRTSQASQSPVDGGARSRLMTVAPVARSADMMARPMPPEPPVTTATSLTVRSCASAGSCSRSCSCRAPARQNVVPERAPQCGSDRAGVDGARIGHDLHREFLFDDLFL